MGRGARDEEEQEGSGGVGEEEEQVGSGGVGEEEGEEGSRLERWERRKVLEGWESKPVGARKRRIVGKGMREKIVLR